MDTLREMFEAGSLMRNSVLISLLLGLVCPLVGVFLVLRRLIFLGVALPQISSCGIACAFAMHTWGIIPHLEEDPEHALAFLGSTVFTLVTILGLAFLERRGRRMTEGRVGTIYVLAGAWSILLLVMNPYGDHGLLDRLRGELIAVTDGDLWMTLLVFGIVSLCLLVFRKELLLVSFDRDSAVALGKRVALWDGLLYLLVGLTVSMAVLTVGPLVTFGFLLLPPLMGHLVARSMWQFAIFSSLIGVLTALAGCWLALRWDLPVGPTDVALMGGLYLLLFLLKKGIQWAGRPRGTATPEPL